MKYILLLALFIWSCKNNTQPSSKVIPTEKSKLLGTWKNINSQGPDFRLEQDSVVFLQENPLDKFLYELNGDSLKFYFPGFNYTFKLTCFDGDSIHFQNEMTINTFVRVK